MDFGIAIFPTEETIQPGELARATEERGFGSLYVTEHTHIPAARETPYPPGGELPREYSRIYDPLVALGEAAANSERLRLSTGILLIVERDPIVTAKALATLDVLSGGRLEVGVGAGWNLEEMRNHGTDPARRFGVMRERVEAMREIWTSEEASYHGRHVDFDRIWSWPKPAQEPHPPVIVGGNGKTVYDRVLAFGDGWLPNYLGDVEKLAGRIERLQGRAADAGRKPLEITVYGSPRDPAAFERFAEAGAHRCVFWAASEEPAKVLARLDSCAAAVADYRSAGG